MADHPRVQICQPGFDIRTAPDWAFLFNSDWPSLAIAFEQTIPNPSPSTAIKHNLGYPPLTMGWNNIGGNYSYGRQGTGFSVSKDTVTVLGISTSTTITTRCFNIDISKEQEYPLPQSAAAKLPYNDQFGIKQAKKDRLIYSKNLNDFIIHSRAQSPAVLAVATEKGKYFTNVNPGSAQAGPWIAFPIKTSYIPWAYVATSGDSGATYSFNTVNGLEYKNGNLIAALNGNTAGSLIVLRDPLFYPNTVRVVY